MEYRTVFYFYMYNLNAVEIFGILTFAKFGVNL